MVGDLRRERQRRIDKSTRLLKLSAGLCLIRGAPAPRTACSLPSTMSQRTGSTSSVLFALESSTPRWVNYKMEAVSRCKSAVALHINESAFITGQVNGRNVGRLTGRIQTHLPCPRLTVRAAP